MTSSVLPQLPPEYDAGSLQLAFVAIEASLQDLSQRLQRAGEVKHKMENETRAEDATLAEDADLSFTVEARKAYRFRFAIFYETAANADFKFDVDGPASPDLVRMLTAAVAPDASAFSNVAIQEAFQFTEVSVTAASGTAGFVEINGILQNGANDGGVVFRWAQDTSDVGQTTVLAGSFVEYSRL